MNEYFGTKLGRRDYVGKIYKLKWRRNSVVKYNGFMTFFSHLFIFPFPRPAHSLQFWSNLHAQWLKRRVPIDIRAFSGFGAFKFTTRGSAVRKAANRKSLDSRFRAKIASTLESSTVNYP